MTLDDLKQYMLSIGYIPTHEAIAQHFGITRITVQNWNRKGSIPLHSQMKIHLLTRKKLPITMSEPKAEGRPLISLDTLKAHLGTKTDQQLADKIGVARTTIIDWKKKGYIPEYIIKRLLKEFPALSDFRE